MTQGARWRLLRQAQRKLTHRLGGSPLCGTAGNGAGKSTLGNGLASASWTRRGSGMRSRHVEALPDVDDERGTLTVSGTGQRLGGPLQDLHLLWQDALPRPTGQCWR